MTNVELSSAVHRLAAEIVHGGVRAMVSLPRREFVSIRERDNNVWSVHRAQSAMRRGRGKRATRVPSRTRRIFEGETRALIRATVAVLNRRKRRTTSAGILPELSEASHRHAISPGRQALRDEDLVLERGSTRATQYQLTRKGLDRRA